MTILKQTEQSISEEDSKRLVRELGRRLSTLPDFQIFDIASGKRTPKDSFIKTKW